MNQKKYNRIKNFIHSVDPLWEKYISWSPYHYCMNNPVSVVDVNGLAPGDLFKSRQLAVKDFAIIYNPESIKNDKEAATRLYSFKKDGETYYSYTEPIWGDATSVNIPSKKSIPSKTKQEGIAHTHAAYNPSYDRGDGYTATEGGNAGASVLDWKNTKMEPYVYTITHNGSIWELIPKKRTEELIDTTAPSDPKDPSVPQMIELNITIPDKKE